LAACWSALPRIWLDFYLGPLINGSVSTWFAYILAVGFLLIKPAGLFGDPTIERV
jgi:branched-chain amino acid transport system permease protein